MPTKKHPEKDRKQPREYDPEHEEMGYGGDMQHDDPDSDPPEKGRKGGHPHGIEEEEERDQRR